MRMSILGRPDLADRFLSILGSEAHTTVWVFRSKKRNKHILLGLDRGNANVLNTEDIQSMVVQEWEMTHVPEVVKNRFIAFREWDRDRNL